MAFFSSVEKVVEINFSTKLCKETNNQWYKTIPSQYLSIPNNNKQDLTYLVLFGITDTPSIIGNMIPASSCCHHHTILKVLCQSGIATIQILIIFGKTSIFNWNMLYRDRFQLLLRKSWLWKYFIKTATVFAKFLCQSTHFACK